MIPIIPGGWYALDPPPFFPNARPWIFHCGDIEDGDFDKLVAHLPTSRPDHPRKADMVYSDPPWNAGNARYWRTQACLSRPVNWPHFWQCFLRGVQASGAPECWLEMSVAQHPAWLALVESSLPTPHRGPWGCYYGAPIGCKDQIDARRRPNHIHRFGGPDIVGSPEGLRATALTTWVFDHCVRAGDVVIDPCLGRGMTSRVAFAHHATCHGVELNPKRLQASIDWLRRRQFHLRTIPVPPN